MPFRKLVNMIFSFEPGNNVKRPTEATVRQSMSTSYSVDCWSLRSIQLISYIQQ